MCGCFFFAPGPSLGTSLWLGWGCTADSKSRLKRRLHSSAAAGGGCMLDPGALQRTTTKGNNAEKLDTSGEQGKCPESAQIPAQAYHQQGTTIDHKTTSEMASPARLHVRAEARPSGGGTLKVLLFFNLLQPPKLGNASGKSPISSAWTDVCRTSQNTQLSEPLLDFIAKLSGNQIMNYSCLLL